MARYAVPFVTSTTAAGQALAWLRSTAGKDMRVWEVGLFSDSGTAAANVFRLGRPAAVSNASGANLQIPQAEDSSAAAAACAAAFSATTMPTSPTSFMRRFSMPAVLGAGIIWTFPQGLVVPSGPGELVIWASSLAAACSYGGYFVYEE